MIDSTKDNSYYSEFKEPEFKCSDAVIDKNIGMFEFPKSTWSWDLFGDKALVFKLPFKVNAWQRFWTKILFHSKWERIKT